MKIAIVHLSDIHVRGPEDPILRRAARIASGAQAVISNPEAYLLVVTGDVAFSGTREQYKLAEAFFLEIRSLLSKSGKPIFEAFLPGNHDLDFTREPDTRPLLLESIASKLGSIDPRGATISQILAVQESFFEFEACMLKSLPRPEHSRLHYSHSFAVHDQKIRIKCFNTAWVSTNPEKAGQLVFPTPPIDLETDPTELVISAFHHPYNWIVPENSRLFRQYIESTSDVIMTGHEHESSVYVKLNSDVATTYIEGAVLQEASTGHSAFNIVVIDTTDCTYEPFICNWTEDRYAHSNSALYKFVRNKLARKFVFCNNPSFRAVLSDPGAPILHPHKRHIKLEDLFVYPALARKNPERKFEVFKVVASQNVVEYVRSNPRILIFGEDTSGKTSLAKMLCHDLLSDDHLVPVLVNGEDIKGFRENDIRRLLKNAVIEQYDESCVDRFFNLDHNQRLLIIDDWHKVRYGAKGRAAIMESAKTCCGGVICFTSRLYAFEELAETGPFKQAFADFEFCEIKEFGKRLTGRLIEKWHRLGREYSIDPREHNYAVASSEHKISAIIGRGVLPTYPIFLISLLQADTPSSPTAQNAGSYGHILEALITARLAEVSTRSTDIGLMYTYASRIAYFLLKKDRPFLSGRELSELHDEYCHAYKMKLSETEIITDLVKAKILCRDGDSYRFAYKGCYCYFAARYFSENLSARELELRPEIDEMTDRLAWEDFTNIVMFYLYLTRDSKTIEKLLGNAGKIYRECEPSDLEADVQFINRLLKEKPKKLILPSTDIETNRDQYRNQQDEAMNDFDERNALAPNQRVPYDSGLSEILKVTIALQTLRVMGQVLRNFPGVLTAEPKYRLAEASYLLGLRTLRRLLEFAEGQLEELRAIFAQIFKERHPLATTGDLENSADQKIIWLLGAASYGMIKRICSSIGLQDLELTFEEVRQNLGEKMSVRLVDLAIELEYFKAAPEAEIYDLEKDVEKNLFAYKILHDLVSEFLYLHNTDPQVLQRLGSLFGIQTGNPQFLLNKAVGTE